MKIRILTTALWLLVSAALSASAQAVKLDGFAHFAFRVSDLDKTKQFYARLGFESPFQFTDEGKVTEAFVKINDKQFIELYPRTQDSQKLGLMHICFATGDIEAVRSAYMQRGLNPPEAKQGRAGNVLFGLHDPEGQLVEYSQYMPDSLHALDRGKHLGEYRIAERMQQLIETVKDPAAERAFYITKLGLEDGGNRSTLRISGTTEELEFEPSIPESQAKITFVVANLKGTAKALRERGLRSRREHGAVVLSDPDGNIIAFKSVRGGK